MFYKLWCRTSAVGLRTPFAVDLTAVSSVGQLEPFKVALLIDGRWENMFLRPSDDEAPDPFECRFDTFMEAWREARQKLHNPLFVGNVTYVPAKDV